MSPDRITADHRTRLALVYIRQSTAHQVPHHRESQARQRDLLERAVDLGWPRDGVRVIDEDLGHSADASPARSGFEAMVAEAALGKLGLVLALEVSRLARANRDWYHLLDICAVTGTLIADAKGLYDPRLYNDRLLLGLKGTMSEAELHLMKERLVEAMRAKARRGEFQFRLPPAYIWDEAGRVQKHPDAQVRTTVARIFARFSALGTIHQAHFSLVDDGVEVPVLSGPKHTLRWQPRTYGYLHRVLTNPFYAGAYVYGRRQIEESLDRKHRPVKRMRKRPPEACTCCSRTTTRDTSRGRRSSATGGGSGPTAAPAQGAPRDGVSLLQGLVLCGRCGRRMHVRYSRAGRSLRYECREGRRQTGVAICQSFGGMRLERAVERLVLEALEPLGVEAMLEAARAHVQAGEEERTHWQHRLERARYEVELARRQYDAVDPANRLVAQELERRWEKALEALTALEAEVTEHLGAFDAPLAPKEEEKLRRYAEDLEALWHAPATRLRDQKRLVRCLIENVVVTGPDDGPNLEAKVHWVGGEVSALEAPKGRTGVHRWVMDGEVVELVRELATRFSDVQIAFILRCKGLRTAKGLIFTAHRVRRIRTRHGIAGSSRMRLKGKDVYTASQAADLLGVSQPTVVNWIGTGVLRGAQVTPGAPWEVEVTEEDRRRLTAADAPKGWLSLKGAALALGLSQQTVLKRLQSGELEGVRVAVGRRTGWRIHVPERTCDDQPTLF